jgi:hypothetical protein
MNENNREQNKPASKTYDLKYKTVNKILSQ